MSPYRERPSWVRRLNAFGPATGAPEELVPLDPDDLLARARRSTGLDEIGDDAWLETYHRKLGSIDRESNLNLLGRLLCRAETLRVLQTQLRLQDHWKRHPEILDEAIERPIFVVGAPRTGTTILLELLALDPGLRAPIAWESHHPLPHDEVRDAESAMRVAEAEQELWADIQPELMTLHELRSDLPCECIHFLALDFGSAYWAMHYTTPSYDEWAATRPEIAARTYRGHRRFLQTLQHGQPRRRWLLKSPGHLSTMGALFAEYPDAIAVQTHRDPQKFVGSAASTTALIHWLRSEAVEPKVHGQVALLGFQFMLNLVRAGRADGSLPEAGFVDSHYLDLIADPVQTIRKIYERAELAWPDGHDETVRAYLRDKPKGKFGKHEYTLEEYGLDEGMVEEAYADYVAHHGVAREP